MQVTVFVAIMWVTIFVVIKRIEVAVAIMQEVFSGMHCALD